MGYNVHITRKKDWNDQDGDGITSQEWLECVETDPTMRLDGSAEATTEDGDTIRVEAAGLAVWVGYSGHGATGNFAWFDLDGRGNVTVKNPDAEILQKMHQISKRLSAKVQGDEGEEYDARGIQITNNTEDTHDIKPWWRFW